MATIVKGTSKTVTAKLADGRNEKQHDCGENGSHPLSAHDELGRCHVDGCVSCPTYAADNSKENKADNADDSESAAIDPRDADDSKGKSK